MRVNALGLSQGRSALDYGRLIRIHPLHPRVHPFLLLLRSGIFHHLLELSPRSHIQHHEFFHRILPWPAGDRPTLTAVRPGDGNVSLSESTLLSESIAPISLPATARVTADLALGTLPTRVAGDIHHDDAASKRAGGV